MLKLGCWGQPSSAVRSDKALRCHRVFWAEPGAQGAPDKPATGVCTPRSWQCGCAALLLTLITTHQQVDQAHEA